jgi:lysophospholipase L1-like esterase
LRVIQKSALIFFVTIVGLELILQSIGFVMRMATVNEVGRALDENIKNKIFRVMVLGESTSYGVLLEERLRDAYPFLLVKKLNALQEDLRVVVTNYSYPGQISDSVKEVFKQNFRQLKPDLVILHFGVNDTNIALNPYLKMSLLGWEIPSSLHNIKLVKLAMISHSYMSGKRKFYTKGRDGQFVYYNKNLEGHESYNDYFDQSYLNYKEIVEVLKNTSTSYLMLSYFTGPEEIYNLLRTIKEEYNSHYIDLKLEETEENKSLFADDEWHPSKKGHEVIAQKIIVYIKEHRDYFFK